MSRGARPDVKRRHVTMKDVAEHAGVSQTTVSFVMNRTEAFTIPEVTRERVWRAVRELGYRPNAAAKMLRTNRTHSVGFVTDVLASSPFAGEIIRGAQEGAWAHGQLLTIINTGGDSALEEAAVEELLERRVEGIVYASMSHHVVSPPGNLSEGPAVLLNCFEEERTLPSVTPEEVGGGRLATEALLVRGHRRVGFINIDRERARPAAEGRIEGYQEALALHGIPVENLLVRSGNANADDGYRYARELLELSEPPTALFCATDRMAMGAYDAARDLGLSIPEDVSIVGFDDQELISEYLRPALSTVALPFFEMGVWATRYLFDHRADFDEQAPVQHKVSCRFIKRASIAPPRWI